MNDHFASLGIDHEATRSEIDEAFARERDMAWSDERVRELQAGYQTLADPFRRAEYDRTLEPGWGLPSVRACAGPPPRHRSRNPVDRLTQGLPHGLRVTIDWIVTIVGAIAIVLAIKAWVVNPYRIPSSSMEPTLHCAKPANGCEARFSDRVLANRFIYRFSDPKRGDIVVFETPPAARMRCGAGGTFVKRLIGLPGDTRRAALGGRPQLRLHQRQEARRAVHRQEPARRPRSRDVQCAPGAVLHDGRQPPPVVRLARLGDGAAEEPDRQGLRHLLAAESHPFADRLRYHSAAGRSRAPFCHEHDHREHRAAPAAQGPAPLQGGRHGPRALPGDRGPAPPRAGLRGDRDQAAGLRRARDVHRAQAVVRRRRRADVPASTRRRSRRSRSARSATSTARSSTTCARRSARRPASASCARRPPRSPRPRPRRRLRRPRSQPTRQRSRLPPPLRSSRGGRSCCRGRGDCRGRGRRSR